MFLNKLSLPEKEVFISLAMKAAEANGVVVEEEYSMIEEYCKEMGIAFFDARNVKEIDDIVSFFKDSDLTSKKTPKSMCRFHHRTITADIRHRRQHIH